MVIFRWRREIGVQEAPDSQWAPPYPSDEALHYARTPQPWPPPPPALPEQPEPHEPPRGEESEAAGRRRQTRRVVAIGAAVAVVSAWVGVAIFLTPAKTTNTAGALNGAGPSTAVPQFPNNSGGGNGFPRRGTAGVVQSVDGETVMLLDRSGQNVTVHTTVSTTILKTVPLTVAQVKPGDTIVASGVYSDANATLTAGRIAVVAAGAAAQGGGRAFPDTAGGGNYATGTVGTVTGDRLTLKLFDGADLTVSIAPQVMVTASVAGSLRDMTRGEAITVRGPVADNGDVDAYQIQEGTSGGSFGPIPLNSTGSLGLTPARAVQS